MRSKVLIGLVALCALAPACRHSDSHRPPSPSVHIERLDASVSRLGTRNGYALIGVRVRARVCLRGRQGALGTYPDAFEFAHYAVVTIDSRRRWMPVRTVVDRPHWLVPFGESWSGACGEVAVDESIPPEQLVIESLGNPNSCYGLRFGIRVGSSRSSKRIIVGCGGLDRLTYQPRRRSS